ncbi:uncharacterized protein G2W53_041237 [Senna tora]|uniref:Uncharacterized protein n=1 Tax=Senna tora TaxID=362788 RepID=A0A834SES2_9FABA|nr:uncharacterized protein G2W53_041237 [Senna tora]
MGFTQLLNKNFDLCFVNVSKIRPRFLVCNMLRHDPRSIHALTTPIRVSNLVDFKNIVQTDRFHSLAQQDF